MLIRHRNKAWVGLLLTFSFFVLLALIFAPIFQGQNGLEFSELLFNRLAKGSSYFIPELSSKLTPFEKQEVAVSVGMESAAQATQAKAILSRVAPETTSQEAVLSVKGDLARLLGAALEDCNSMYMNDGDVLMRKYGIDGKEALLVWYRVLNGMGKKLQTGENRNVPQSKMILAVVTKGIEPAFNFYGIQPESVSRRAGTTTFLLVFYLAYTVWWGFAIYFLFEGFGLAMTKPRIKREV